jgi:hypothetical protein
LRNVAHPYTAFASFDQFNLVTNSNLTLLQHTVTKGRDFIGPTC